MPTGWPTLDDVRTFLRLPPDVTEDAVIEAALDAAIDYGNRRTAYKFDPTVDQPVDPPATVNYAAKVHAAMLYKRRDSTDGTIGFGDAGVVRVTARDSTAESLYATVGPMVVG